MVRRHKDNWHERNKHKSSKSFSYNLKNFFFWFIIYVLSISLFTILLKNTKIYEAKIGFYLIMGFFLVIVSRVIYSAKRKRSFRFKGIFIWVIIYSVVFGLLSKVLSLFPSIQLNSAYDFYLNLILLSIIFTIVIMFLRRMKFKTGKVRRNTPLFLRAPSQIISGIGLFIAGLLVFRFSYQIFVGWFNWAEGMAWSWLIGIIFIVAGLLTLKAWWKNSVSNFNTQHNFHWKH
ncbi:MAG: hypothetical protein AABX96_01535 [Nanoarchaeota archaeon]